jgi:hypothetical protein
MSAQPHRESTRRANPAQTSAPPVKEEPLTWEEEELAAYEPKRVKAVDEQRRAEAKMALLARQLPNQWKALREILVIRCESVNARARRTVLRAFAQGQDCLEIRREDESKIQINFEADKKKVTFSGKVLVYDREYELVVQTYNDVDTTVWYSHATLTNEQPDDLAKSMISILLRADQ